MITPELAHPGLSLLLPEHLYRLHYITSLFACQADFNLPLNAAKALDF
uniref:Uncharacterized protein n=1 Tax=Dulem virus 39 TaxID=3145757 RepID=A0AAU8B5E9_9CAUD